MARPREKLTARKVQTLAEPGLYGDGGGLWLQVTRGAPARDGAPTVNKSWVLRYSRAGRAREMGLGPFADVPLARARAKAAEARALLHDGKDPIEEKRAQRAAARQAAASAVTFQAAAERYIAAHAPGWRNPKHAAQWPATLAAYAYPVIGAQPVAAIDTGLVLRILEPIWTSKPETAGRVRGRIELVLDWAAARGYRQGDNPARWRGHLDKLLPRRSKVAPVRHHAALPYAELPAFFAELHKLEGVAPRALEFAILTAARTGEVIGTEPGEIDFTAKVWTVPAARMKSAREHRVPLSDRACEVARAALALGNGDAVFEGPRSGKPLSNMALLKVLQRMGRTDLTTHGFRSTFRDWAAERTSYPAEVAEMALAHVVPDKVEAAYRRGDLFPKRRRLMADWARFCGSTPAKGEVVPLRGTAGRSF